MLLRRKSPAYERIRGIGLLVILIVLLMGVGAGAYFAGRSYGTIGIIVVIGVGLTFIYGLYALGAISFIK